MNAIQFIKEHGVEKAREVVSGAPQNAVYYWQIPRCKYGVYSSHEQKQGRAIVLEELKRLVESVDLIDSLGGLELSKKESNDCRFYEYADMSHRSYAIKQAIADYESIYGGEHV
jgi:hypothetical protein